MASFPSCTRERTCLKSSALYFSVLQALAQTNNAQNPTSPQARSKSAYPLKTLTRVGTFRRNVRVPAPTPTRPARTARRAVPTHTSAHDSTANAARSKPDFLSSRYTILAPLPRRSSASRWFHSIPPSRRLQPRTHPAKQPPTQLNIQRPKHFHPTPTKWQWHSESLTNPCRDQFFCGIGGICGSCLAGLRIIRGGVEFGERSFSGRGCFGPCAGYGRPWRRSSRSVAGPRRCGRGRRSWRRRHCPVLPGRRTGRR